MATMSVPSAVRVLINVAKGSRPARQVIKEALQVAEASLTETPKPRTRKKAKS